MKSNYLRRGTKNRLPPSRNVVSRGNKEEYKKINAVVTAYTDGIESTGKSPGHPAYGLTASGINTQSGITAACPPQIELGTWIVIEDVGKRRCDDRGSAIKGNRYDVYMQHLDNAINFGKQNLKVTILKKE